MTVPTMHTEQNLIAELAKAPDDKARSTILGRHPQVFSREFIEKLSDEVVHRIRVDANAAVSLGRASLIIANELNENEAIGISLRSVANGLYGAGQYRQAVEHYTNAAETLEQAGALLEMARTLSSSTQARILLGEYDEAYEAAQRARGVFEELGETKRIARLDINIGNILHRQDRFQEALPLYRRAYQALITFQDAEAVEGVAAALSNISGCLIMLNDFNLALEQYREARAVCEQHGMPSLVAQADYNIAYMYFLRGEYSRATEMLNTARQLFRESGDDYHQTLCDMDQAELYLDLNLYSEAARLAQRAAKQFAKLGTEYERAKSMALEAIALGNRGEAMRALELFSDAREIFVREQNGAWPWTIDLYRALLFEDRGRVFEAHRLASKVVSVFEEAGLGAKAIVCRLLLARLALGIGDVRQAARHCDTALGRAREIDSPLYAHQAYFLQGQIAEADGNPDRALASYEDSAQTLESLRSSLQREEMKIAFLANRLGAYEALVDLSLQHSADEGIQETVLDYIEKSKARALIDVILGSIRGRRAVGSGESELARRVQFLREELNWYYGRIERAQLSREQFNPKVVGELARTAKVRENELLDVLREEPDGEEYARLRDSAPVSLARIQNTLESDRCLVEYYIARGRIYVCVIGRDQIDIRALAVAEHVKGLVQRLQFQISKYQLPSDYVETFDDSIQEATLDHLRELHKHLIEPIETLFRGRDIVVIPHAFLHYLPFQALYNGERYVIDDYAVSYAPSASIYVHCHERASISGSRALVLGVADATVPSILEEVHSVAKIMPNAELVLDDDATLETLRSKAKNCQLVHIATHGYFRKDNPMFSAIRLSDSHLTLYDLYELSLPVELITVSACATGLSVVVEGDEILGLVRGFLYAGARSLVTTQWNVQDETTASMMKSFYSHLSRNRDRAAALRCAMLEQRSKTPQPYYWAPYMLVGKVLSPQAATWP